jgi:hypothetical protein
LYLSPEIVKPEIVKAGRPKTFVLGARSLRTAAEGELKHAPLEAIRSLQCVNTKGVGGRYWA